MRFGDCCWLGFTNVGTRFCAFLGVDGVDGDVGDDDDREEEDDDLRAFDVSDDRTTTECDGLCLALFGDTGTGPLR